MKLSLPDAGLIPEKSSVMIFLMDFDYPLNHSICYRVEVINLWPDYHSLKLSRDRHFSNSFE